MCSCLVVTTWILSLGCIVTLLRETVTPLYRHITTWILSLGCIVTLVREAVTPLYCHITTWILSLRCIVTLRHEYCHSTVLSHYDMSSVTSLDCDFTTWILSPRCIVPLRHEYCHSAAFSHYDMSSVTPLYCHITTWMLSLRCIVTYFLRNLPTVHCFHSWLLSHISHSTFCAQLSALDRYVRQYRDSHSIFSTYFCPRQRLLRERPPNYYVVRILSSFI